MTGMVDTSIPAANVGEEDPDHVAAMVALADGQAPAGDPAVPPEGDAPTGEPAATPEGEPQTFAGKYKSVEDLEKGYLELQKKLGQGADPADPAPADADLPAPTDGEGEGEPGSEIDFDRYSQSIAENGSLTDDDYAEIQSKHNLPRAVVDMYIAGLQSTAASRVSAATDAVGGEENFNAIRAWAASLPEAEYNAFQNQIRAASSNEELAVVYGTLATRYKAVNPAEPDLIAPSASPTGQVTGYASSKQMSDAINDPRYRNDPAYRAEVARKIEHSNF